ncbi:MAG: preprotein translocase subunit SecE [Clostridia bacterium]|nr:preprotein translocase subunit SecE [Clostridia bacterium]
MAETKTNKPAKTPFKERVAKFFREYKSEIKKISWSSRAQTLNNTWAVLVASVAIAVVIAVVDLGVSRGIQWLGNLI